MVLLKINISRKTSPFLDSYEHVLLPRHMDCPAHGYCMRRKVGQGLKLMNRVIFEPSQIDVAFLCLDFRDKPDVHCYRSSRFRLSHFCPYTAYRAVLLVERFVKRLMLASNILLGLSNSQFSLQSDHIAQIDVTN